MKLTLQERIAWARFTLGLWCDRARLSFQWNPFGVRHRWWALMLNMEHPERASREDVEARARFLASLAAKSPEEIERQLAEATYRAHIEPQVRAVGEERDVEASRARKVLTHYRDAMRAKGKYVRDEPDDTAERSA